MNLTNGNISIEDTQCFVPGSTIDRPKMTVTCCEQRCGPYYRAISDSVPRLVTWFLPVVLLSTNIHLSPIGWQKYLAILHLLGDPVHSSRTLFRRVAIWDHYARYSQPHAEGAETQQGILSILKLFGIGILKLFGIIRILKLFGIKGIQQDSRAKNLAVILASLGEQVGGLADDLRPYSERNILKQTAGELVDCRTKEMLRICSALILYFWQVVAAFIPAIGQSNSPSGGMLVSASLLSWLLPVALLSNAIGGFSSTRSSARIIYRFSVQINIDAIQQPILDAIQQPILDAIQQPILDAIQQPTLDLGLLQEETATGTTIRAWHSLGIWFHSFLPVGIAFGTAFAVVDTPPTYLTCRNFLIIGIFFSWLLSSLCTCVIRHPITSWIIHTACPFVTSQHVTRLKLYLILIKDTLFALPILALLIGTSCGLFTSCWCLSNPYGAGKAEAYVDLNPEEYSINSGLRYPITVSISFLLQCLIFTSARFIFWEKGFEIWVWSEEEKQTRFMEACQTEMSVQPPQQPAVVLEDTPVEHIAVEPSPDEPQPAEQLAEQSAEQLAEQSAEQLASRAADGAAD